MNRLPEADTPFYPYHFTNPEFPFAIISSPDHGDFPLHRHSFTELVYIVAGHGRHILDGHTAAIREGDCFVIPTKSTHAYAEGIGLHLINILFDNHLLAPFQAELNQLPGYHAFFTLEPSYRKQYDTQGRLRTTFAQRMAVMDLLRQMQAEATAQNPGYRGKLLALFAQLLIDLARFYQEIERRPSAQLVQIGAVISKIEHDYATPLTITELADIANMSPRNLARRFREGVGMPPIEYLLRLRLRRAASLLRDTSQSITDISSAVGIMDSNYFSRQFKRIYGVNPRAFQCGNANTDLP